MKRELLADLLAAREAKRSVVLATWLETGEQALVEPSAEASPEVVPSSLREASRAACRADRSSAVATDDGDVFLQVFNPPVRLIVVGAVHIAQPLVRMARELGFDVVVVDPRLAFATEARFPDVERFTEWPDEALEVLGLNPRTAVVTLTHDPKLDDPALAVALESEAFFIGALGSRRTHQKRLARLRERGFEEPTLKRIRGPVGLSIGARTPAEIAVSVLAQLIEALRQDPS